MAALLVFAAAAGSVWSVLALRDAMGRMASMRRHPSSAGPSLSEVAAHHHVVLRGRPGSHAHGLASAVVAKVGALAVVAVCSAAGVAVLAGVPALLAAAVGAVGGYGLSRLSVSHPWATQWAKAKAGALAEEDAALRIVRCPGVAAVVCGWMPKGSRIGDVDLTVVHADGAVTVVEVKSGTGPVWEGADGGVVAGGRPLRAAPLRQAGRQAKAATAVLGREVGAVVYLPRAMGDGLPRRSSVGPVLVAGHGVEVPRGLIEARGAPSPGPDTVRATLRSLGFRLSRSERALVMGGSHQ